MRVFVLEPTEYNMHKAKKFGPLVFLFADASEHAPWHQPEFLQQVAEAFERRGFSPGVDVIAMSGNMMSVSIMVAVAVDAYEFIKLIGFDHDKDVRDFRMVDLSYCPKVESESHEPA